MGNFSSSSSLLFLISLCLLSLLHIPSTFATKKSYIVYLGAHSHGLKQSSSTSLHELDRVVTDSHCELLQPFVGSIENAKESIMYSYTRHINGFAALLEQEEADEIAKHPNVISVFLNKGRKLHTTRSWNFLGLEKDNDDIPSHSIWNKARFGEDAIIANLDTGVWPESKSFNDEGMGPVPSKWRGFCDDAEGVRCNRKLIGARYFNKGYSQYAGSLNSTVLNSARDNEGHGTHTLSTAGGSFVAGANVFGFGNGTAKGGSPKARVASYKVCWPPINQQECFDSDIMAAFDAAISDGVDVLSLSLGGAPSDYFLDGISIGAFHAVMNGIVVVSSAGNEGPVEGTVSNVAPWMLTVGASTIDREFANYIALGNKQHLKGSSLSAQHLPERKFYPLISATSVVSANGSIQDATLCKTGSLDGEKVKGKILVCVRGENSRVEKGQQAALAGAVGMILVNDMKSGNEIISDAHFLPASHITYTDGQSVLAYINSTKSPMAFMTNVRTELGTKAAPFVASFSSTGPNTITPHILKPDITAPGVNIIAAFTEATSPSGLPFDKRRIPFATLSGTSMSCPHVSGIVGLLKTLHPEWSPAAIRSAIITTAITRDHTLKPMLNSSKLKATPFSYGAGEVNPNKAMDPGLVYDMNTTDYLHFLCAIGYNERQMRLFSEDKFTGSKNVTRLEDFNYPSITVPNLSASVGVTITRRVKNVGKSSNAIYKAKIKAPPGVSVSVEPNVLKFERIGEEKKFKLTFKMANRVKTGNGYVYGKLKWSDGKHYVRSPIVVKIH